MTARSIKMFRIMRKLGHDIAAWDEEALVHMQPETYFTRRLSPVAIQYVSHLFAWGEENAELWRQYPALPEGLPIHVTGNPRGDLLRPEMLHYFSHEAEERRKTYGDFILINTNFSNVNAFVPSLNLFLPVSKPGEEPRFGRAAVGMSREFAEGLRHHKQAIFEDFKRLIPALEKAFPEVTMVVRPHPTENPKVYHDIAARCERVRVTSEGNVVPWLMAAKALVHNGCTTGVEAYVMGVPAATYQATVNQYYDYGYYRLPNLLSHQCFDFEQLQTTLTKILTGELGRAGGDERQELVDHYLAARDGPLACERMVDAFESIMEGRSGSPRPVFSDRLNGWYRATERRLIKWVKSYVPGSKYRPEFQRHRYPGLSLDSLHARIARFRQLLGKSGEIRTEQISDSIFRISD
jgi:surface carbohydrate biosynthesis protein